MSEHLTKTCGTCYFWVAVDGAEQVGQCHFEPPKGVLLPMASPVLAGAGPARAGIATLTVWPQTRADEVGCGRWKTTERERYQSPGPG